MYQDNKYPILIAGAGIGGLTTAIALQKQGFAVKVFERCEDILEKKGTALHIWSNAVTALNHLGLGDAVVSKGVPIIRSTVSSWKGQLLIDTPVGQIVQGIGIPSVNIRRSDLVQILYNACQDIPIHFGSQCIGYSEDDDSVTLHLVGGEKVKGRALIGADGIRSLVRAQLVGDGEPTYLGYTIWRGISESMVKLEPGNSSFFWGPGSVRGGCWAVDESHVSWTMGVDTAPGGKDEFGKVKSRVLKLVAGCPEPLSKAIELTPEECIFRIDAYARENADIWGAGRVALLGDAAHASPTVYGQGACQAIEDAIVLAESVANASDVVTGLRLYEERRKPRVSWIRSKIFSATSAHNLHHPLLCWLRNMYVRHFFPKEASLKTWQRLLTFDK